MRSLILLLIISLALLGFKINGKKPEPKTVEYATLDDLDSTQSLDESQKVKIFNEMGDVLNETSDNIGSKKTVEITSVNVGLSAKLFSKPSSLVTDKNGLTEDLLSYRDNFPYESNYLKKIDSSVSRQINIKNIKAQSQLSSVLLPEGVKEYIEDFDYFKKSIPLVRDRLGRDKLLVPPHYRILDPTQKTVDTLPNVIIFKTKPDNYDYHRVKNLTNVRDKTNVYYDNSKKLDDAKNIFKF